MASFESSIHNGGAGQDMVFTYEADEGGLWAICCDGHGTPDHGFLSLNEWLAEYDWKEYFEKCIASPDRCPGKLLDEAISHLEDQTLGEGACVLIAHLSDTTVKMWWRGDVVGRLYTGEDLLVSTTPHSSISLEGIKSPADLNVEWQVKALNSHELTTVPSARVNLNPHYDRTGILHHQFADLLDNCAVYNCLGHRGWARGKWGTLSMPVTRLSDLSVVIGSDGLWDMLGEDEIKSLPSREYFTAEGLVNLAADRWRQNWRYIWHGQVVQTLQKIDSADDVSCIILRRE